MFNKKKKIMYVPDEEIMLYNKAKKDVNSALENNKTVATPEPEIQVTAEPETVNEAEKISENPTIVESNVEAKAEANVEVEVEAITQPQAKTIEDSDKAVSTSDKSFKSVLRNFYNKVKQFIVMAIPSKKDNVKTLIIKIVTIVAAVALLVSAVYLVVYFVDLGQQDAKVENVQNIYEPNRNDYTKNDNNQFSKFDVLKAKNKDIVGWLSIPGTKVDNPVYQCADNQFYVTHDMDKQVNSYGALFLDYRCNINPMSLTRNQIIYGHNMRYGAMFGTLDEYRDVNYLRKNPIISFDSLYEKRNYKIFAVMIVNDTEDSTFGYSYSAYRTTFTNDTDFMQWIEHSRQRSLYDIPVDINADDEIITLSTCCYDFNNARFVILGRLVRNDESADVDINNISINKDVLYSKEYYEKKKLPIPTLTSSENTTSE